MATTFALQQMGPESDTLSPLPPTERRGMTAIAVFGTMSFVSTLSLGSYLAYRIVDRKLKGYRQSQILILVFNLMLADLQQAIPYMMEAHWLMLDAIEVGTGACWAQGWFKSIGNLSSALFCLAIGVHTFAFITFKFQLSTLRFYLAIALLWTVVFIFAIGGASTHPHDWFTRAGAWCWINGKYSKLRIILYFNTLAFVDASTLLLYGTLFVILRLRIRSGHYNNRSSDRNLSAKALVVSKLMFAYPFSYIGCTLPLVILPILTSRHIKITTEHLCAGAALFASIGWVDVLLYGLTRRLEPAERGGAAAAVAGQNGSDSDLDPLDSFDSWWTYRIAEGFYGTTATCEASSPATPKRRHVLMAMLRRRQQRCGRGADGSVGVQTRTTVDVTTAPLDVEARAAMAASDEYVFKAVKHDSGDTINIETRSVMSKES